MARLRCVVEYDGTGFAGFQVQSGQPQVRTVQGALESAVLASTAAPSRVIGAGRTDAGVHAAGQVVHFDTDNSWEPAVWQAALNARLPPDVVIRSVNVAPAEFHARYSARSREYRYAVYNLPIRSPIVARWTWQVPEPLNVEQMNAAADECRGEQDFRAFAARDNPTSTVRRILRLSCRRFADIVVVEVTANAFLRHMVRRLVGSLVRVGSGRLRPESLREIIDAKQRGLAGPTVPPAGLCLMKVNY
ncbi:MAG: tRNA pseudouridine(38-40) synthase TruA [Dehalococcoidia bacterium]|nr:tRNA pseudouridine(38-40) synthase TruA [Dehalococcoidia bacterium]